MELWFWAALGGALFAGISNVYFKQAAARGYNAELFSLYGSVLSILLVSMALIFYPVSIAGYGIIAWLVFLGGLIAALTGISKVYALRYIDTTIYFPLFKLLAPALAIVIGIFVFAESFTKVEWIGMILGLLVPLLLITKAENSRQKNLLAGLALVLFTGVLSAATAALNKYATDLVMPILTILLYTAAGIFIGTMMTITFKQGIKNVVSNVKTHTSWGLILSACLRSGLITISLALMLLAYYLGGTLAIVQTIHSLYILIPIVLSVILYNEHWNTQKVIAVLISVAALALLG